MSNKKELSTVFLGVVALLVLGGLGAFWPKWVDANIGSAVAAPDAVIADAITHQGYLTDDKGNPLNGSFVMRFRLYNASAGGTLLWDSANQNVTVVDGLFSVKLEIAEDIFNGEELWLAQTVEGELLTPRQEILPTPLAHSLRPGAVIKGTASAITNNYTLEVVLNNDVFGFNRGAIRGETTTGNAIYGLAPNGRAVYGQTEDGYAVYGFDGGSTEAKGYGGYFYSTNGVGVYGYSGADRTAQNLFAPGVYGQSREGVGVYGRGDTSDSHSFYNEGGRFEGGSGVYGRGTDSNGYGGEFRSAYRGLYALGGTSYAAYFAGSLGISTWSVTNRSGARRSLAMNLGDSVIQQGDIVALAGVFSHENGEVILGVEKVNAQNQNGVIGVVAETIAAQKVQQEDGSEYVDFSPTSGSAKQEDYLTIITDGLAPAVNLDAVGRSVSWEIGDTLVLSAISSVGRASSGSDEIVIGKVAGPIDVQNGTIPLFIDID